jgi:hypothetical protein
MDVSAIASGSGTPAPAPGENAAPAQTLPQPQLQPATGDAKTPGQHSGLAPAVAKLFGGGGSQPSLSVSYRVIKGDPPEIVTVFTDPKTGQEVAQFPPQELIGLAQFFDQENGVTLDQNA